MGIENKSKIIPSNKFAGKRSETRHGSFHGKNVAGVDQECRIESPKEKQVIKKSNDKSQNSKDLSEKVSITEATKNLISKKESNAVDRLIKTQNPKCDDNNLAPTELTLEASSSIESKNTDQPSYFNKIIDYIKVNFCKLFAFFVELDLVTVLKKDGSLNKKALHSIRNKTLEQLQEKLEQGLNKEVKNIKSEAERQEKKIVILIDLLNHIADTYYIVDQDSAPQLNRNDFFYSNLAIYLKPNIADTEEIEEINKLQTCLRNIFNDHIQTKIDDIDFSIKYPSDDIAIYSLNQTGYTKLETLKLKAETDSIENIMSQIAKDIPRGFSDFKLKMDDKIVWSSHDNKEFNDNLFQITMTESSHEKNNIALDMTKNIIYPQIENFIDSIDVKSNKDQIIKDLLLQLHQGCLAQTFLAASSMLEKAKDGKVVKDYSLQLSMAANKSVYFSTEISAKSHSNDIIVDNSYTKLLDLRDPITDNNLIAQPKKLYATDSRLIYKIDATEATYESITIHSSNYTKVTDVVNELFVLYENADDDSRDNNMLVAELQQIVMNKADISLDDINNIFTSPEKYYFKRLLRSRLIKKQDIDKDDLTEKKVIFKTEIEKFLSYLDKEKNLLTSEDQQKVMAAIIEILNLELSEL